ncbi:terminase small subunit [Escherichia coli]|uniref:terminase small subunit n=1 Tax=Escherichia coli TaxID=562 RepID=UPI003CC835D5
MLTGQKRKFAQALMSGSSQAEAARKAGYSEKTARSQGSRLAKDPDIIAFISKKRGAEVIVEQAVSEPDELPKVVNRTVKEFDDPLEFLKAVMNDVSEETDVRKDAAKAMLPYLHPKKGEGGKKDARHAAAAKVAATGSKFGAMAPPKLVVNNKG